MVLRSPRAQGWYLPTAPPLPGKPAVLEALQRLDAPFAVVRAAEGPAVATGGQATFAGGPVPAGALPLLAWVPALTPDRLGDPAFQAEYGVRASYVAGEMASG